METKPSVLKAESNDNIKETLLSNDALEKIAGGETYKDFCARLAGAKTDIERQHIKASVSARQMEEWAKSEFK